ncbi:Cys-rich domain containing protein [Musa troglodytarum]|uniref:Cys-rich domain containing protein n=1 Tax=Musa troglodytarum TaxID=320322 RepID=A0A9E7GG97_9LILI|nr:Cys-rich domain containing protein [Musa troglodytarum]
MPEAEEKKEAPVVETDKEAAEDDDAGGRDVATVVDFDMLCATVALQTQGLSVGKARRKDSVAEAADEEAGLEFDGVQRMWEGDVMDCFEDRRIAIEAAFCPCYRFGKNMQRANLGSWFLQGSDGSLDDCVNHLICPCCTLCQESRTLEMNNVQNGVWHGRGDTLCLATGGEGSKVFTALHKPPLFPTKSPDLCSMERSTNGSEHSWNADGSHSEPLVPSDQLQQGDSNTS